MVEIDQDTTTALINGIIDKASEGKRKNVEELVRQLFPTIEWTIGGMQYDGGFSKGWLRDMRICHPSNFDKYFQFKIPKGELSNSDLKEMLLLTADSTKFSEFIMSLMERNILKNALSQFESFTDDIPLENGYTYIKALLDIGDKIDHEAVGFTMFSSNTHAMRLAVWFLRRIEDRKKRGELLLECFLNSEGISIVEYILHTDESRKDKAETDIVLLDHEFEQIKVEFLSKLDSMAENTPDKLISHEHLVSFLYRWARWGDEAKVIDWLKSQTESAEGCVNLLKAFVSKSSSQTMGSYVTKITSSIQLKNIENFLPVEPISDIIKSITKTDYDAKGQEAIEAFNDALERREKGTEEEWSRI